MDLLGQILLHVISSANFRRGIRPCRRHIGKWEEEYPLKSANHKKVFREDAEGMKKLTKSAQRKLTVTAVAVVAIALVLLGAGLGYFHKGSSKDEKASFEKMEDSLKGQMREEMAEASAYLEKLDGNIAENQKKLEEVNSQLEKRQQSLLEAETIQRKLEENASDVSVGMKELDKKTKTQMQALRDNMDSVHTDIQKTLQEISSVITVLEKAEQDREANREASRQELSKVEESILTIHTSIGKVETNLRESYDNLNTLLKELQGREEKNQTEVIRQLADVESSMKHLLETDMAKIADTFSALAQDFQVQLGDLNALWEGKLNALGQNVEGKFEGLGQDMDGRFAGLNQNMDGKFTGLLLDMDGRFRSLGQNLDGTLSGLGVQMDQNFRIANQTLLDRFSDLVTESGQDSEEVMAYLESIYNALRQDLNQVFTYVSNGKKGLASALLTKGVSVGEDASFAGIRDAILRIDQKLVLGVEQIPGTIRYEYHYHTDGAGNNPHTENSPSPGGCYNTAATHFHTNACFWEEQIHEHNSECPSRPYLVDWVEEPYWAKEYLCNDMPLNTTLRHRKCGMEEGAVSGYRASCGMLDGQITAAHIVYDAASADAAAAAEQTSQETAEVEEGACAAKEYAGETDQENFAPKAVESELETQSATEEEEKAVDHGEQTEKESETQMTAEETESETRGETGQTEGIEEREEIGQKETEAINREGAEYETQTEGGDMQPLIT